MEKKHWIVFILTILLVTSGMVLGCSKKEAQEGGEEVNAPQGNAPPAEAPAPAETRPEAKKMPPDMPDLPKMPSDLAELEALTKDLKNMPKPVDPVDPLSLKALIPEPPKGWTLSGGPSYEKNTMGNFTISIAKQSYIFGGEGEGGSTVRVEINDNAHVPMLYIPWKMIDLIQRDSDTDYMKSAKVKEHPALERYHYVRKTGELSVLVGDRFVVGVKGERIEDIKTLHDFMDLIDLKKLASLAG